MIECLWRRGDCRARLGARECMLSLTRSGLASSSSRCAPAPLHASTQRPLLFVMAPRGPSRGPARTHRCTQHLGTACSTCHSVLSRSVRPVGRATTPHAARDGERWAKHRARPAPWRRRRRWFPASTPRTPAACQGHRILETRYAYGVCSCSVCPNTRLQWPPGPLAARDLGRLEEAIAAIAAGAAAFELSTCRIGAAGADRLAAALQSSTAITRVDLRGECVAARGRWRRMHPV